MGSFDLDTPQGRFAASQAMDNTAYNAAMAAHHKASSVEVVNGYGLRWVASRFGRLCMVQGDGAAFRTIQEARAHAASLAPNADEA